MMYQLGGGVRRAEGSYTSPEPICSCLFPCDCSDWDLQVHENSNARVPVRQRAQCSLFVEFRILTAGHGVNDEVLVFAIPTELIIVGCLLGSKESIHN